MPKTRINFDLKKDLKIQAEFIRGILSLVKEYRKKYPEHERLLDVNKMRTADCIIRVTTNFVCEARDDIYTSEGLRENPKAKRYQEHIIPVKQIVENIDENPSLANIQKELLSAEIAILTNEEAQTYRGKKSPHFGVFGETHRSPEQIEKFKKHFKLKNQKKS